MADPVFKWLLPLLFSLWINTERAAADIASYAESPKLIFDITEEIANLNNKNISESFEVVTKNVNATFEFESIFYSTKSVTKKQLQSEIQKLWFIINSSATHLTISVPYKNRNLMQTDRFGQFFEKQNSTESLLSRDLKVAVIINLGKPNETTCGDYLVTELQSTINSLKTFNIKVGLGYEDNGQIQNCKQILDGVDFLFNSVNLKMFVESYGLFERTLDKVHKKNQKFLRKSIDLVPNIIYSPYFDVTSCHYKLIQFAEDWVSRVDNTNIEMVVPLTYNSSKYIDCGNKTETDLAISTILEAESNNEENINWYEGTALEAINEKFKFILLSESQWDVFVASSPVQQQTKPGTFPYIFLEYSNASQLIWKDFEKTNKNLRTLIKAVVIPIDWRRDLSTNSKDFLTQMEKQDLSLGCSFNTYEGLSEEKVQTTLKNCEKLGGRFAIFPILLDLHEALLFDFSHAYFLDSIQKPLSQLKKTQESRFSNVKIYIRIVTKPSPKIDKSYPSTVFCNEKVLKANQFYEGVLNWAKRNNFPAILKSAFDSISQPDISTWLSVLRPPYTVFSFSSGFSQLRTSQPIFVMRNYPENINNWMTNPCITWMSRNQMQETSIDTDFRQQGQIGAVINMDIQRDNSISVAEFQTMFQFVLHKFSAVELVWRHATDVLTAVDAVSSDFFESLAKTNLTTRTKFFMNYNIQEGDLRPERLPSIFQKFREFQQNTLISAEGVHVHYSEILKTEKEGRSYSFPKLLTSASTIGNLQVGLVIPGTCMDELQLAQLNKTSGLHKALQNIIYIVCIEVVDVEATNGRSELGTLFDTHLYTKKMLEKDYPGLRLYFKLKLDIDLGESRGEIMEKYKHFLQNCQKFGAAYDIQYFLVEAFDSESRVDKKKNGWWKITDYTDLTNVDVYVEKKAERAGRETWRPKILTSASGINKKGKSKDSGTTLLISLLSGVTALFILRLCVGMFIGYRYRRAHVNAYLTAKEELDFLKGTVAIWHTNTTDNLQTDHLRFDTNYELSYTDLNIDTQMVLGTGQFGIVYCGELKGLKAAVKIPSKSCGKENFKNVLSEVKVLCHLGNHQHIVRFLGAYVQEIRKGTLYIVTELCENGSLERVLRLKKDVMLPTDSRYTNMNTLSRNHLMASELIRFSLEIARGMDYIGSKNAVHGDLAARNVLLDSKLECKISDFGLSRKVYEYQKYTKTSQEPLPWKWMAYESLTQMEFTSMSDMWSYGVTVWEIFSLGHMPFAGLNWTPTFANELRNGLRLPIPQFASQEIYQKLLQCWSLDVEQRPTFSEVAEFLQNLESTEYENM